MAAFRVRSRIEALSDPLVTGPLLQGETTVFDPAASVPALDAIPAGFDAIFQFTTPLLSDYLGRLLGRTALAYVSFDTTLLNPATKHEILTRLQAALAATSTTTSTGITITVTGGTSTGQAPTTQITELPNPLVLRVTAHSPTVDVALVARNFDAGAVWAVDVEVGIPQATSPSGFNPAGLSFPVGSLSLGVGGGQVTTGAGQPTQTGTVPAGGVTSLRFVLLTHGAADTQAHIRVSTAPQQYQAWARLDFTGTNVNINAAGDALFSDLLNGEVNAQLTNAIQQALTIIFANPDLRITPRTALGGALQPNEQLSGVQNFNVDHTTSAGNRHGRRVLSLCVDVGAGSAGGDLALVRPFVDGKNFAYYLSEPIVRSALQVRWARLPPPLEFTAKVAINMQLSRDAETVIQGGGRIRFRILDVTDIIFDVTTVDLPDAIRVSGNAETTLLEAWDDDQQKIDDLEVYGSPVVDSYALRIYPFGGVPLLTPGPAQKFFEEIVAQLLEPLDRPSAEVFEVSAVDGMISSPLSALFVRAHLSF
jgi:hypothetical protein